MKLSRGTSFYTTSRGLMMKKNRFVIIVIVVLILNISILVNIPQLSLSSSDTTSTDQDFNLVELGQIDTGGLAYEIQVIGDIAYIGDGFGGLLLVDVSDPENPQEISSLHGGTGSPEDICIIDDLAFVADGADGLNIINISDSSSPVEIGSFNDGGLVHSVAVTGDHAFIVDGEGIEVVDIRNPTNPTEITQYNHTGTWDISLANGLVFVASNVVSAGIIQDSDLTIMNISDVHNMQKIEELNPDYGCITFSTFVSGNIGYFSQHGSNTGIKLLDFSDVSNLREISWFDFRADGVPNKIDVIDNFVYVACGDSGLKIINFSNLENPVETAHYYDGGYAYDVKVVGNLAYVADRQDGLEIIQLYSEGSSESQGTTNTAIPGFELPVILFVAFSYFFTRKRTRKNIYKK